MILCRSLGLRLGDRTILNDVTIALQPGERTCIVGPSGSGKSVVVDLLLGFRLASSGSIDIDGVDIGTLPSPLLQLYRRSVGTVLQKITFVPHATVAENVALPLQATDMHDDVIAERVHETLQQCGIDHVASRQVSTCSNGEQSMIAFARSIVHRPTLLIIDGLFDILSDEHLLIVLRQMQQLQKRGTTMLCTTRDRAVAEKFGGNIIALQEGSIVRNTATTADVASSQEPPESAEESLLSAHIPIAGEESIPPRESPGTSSMPFAPLARTSEGRSGVENELSAFAEEKEGQPSLPVRAARQDALDAPHRGYARQGRYIAKERPKKHHLPTKIRRLSSGLMDKRKVEVDPAVIQVRAGE